MGGLYLSQPFFPPYYGKDWVPSHPKAVKPWQTLPTPCRGGGPGLGPPLSRKELKGFLKAKTKESFIYIKNEFFHNKNLMTFESKSH